MSRLLPSLLRLGMQSQGEPDVQQCRQEEDKDTKPERMEDLL